MYVLNKRSRINSTVKNPGFYSLIQMKNTKDFICVTTARSSNEPAWVGYH